MWIAPVIALAAAIYLAFSMPAGLAVAGPILGLWFASPAIAWWISRPLYRRAARLTATRPASSRRFPERPGPSSRPSSAQKIIGYRRITIRSILWPGSPIAPDQHGTGAPGEFSRLRLRLHFSRTTRRTHGECTPHDGSFGATPRPLLQLVRHAVYATTVAHLHFDSGQWKPGGPSADLAGRFARTSR